MRPRQGMQVRVIAGGIVLALTLSPFASAQKIISSQTMSPSASQPLEDQLPDSPGTVQSRPKQPQQLASLSAQADNRQAPDTEQTSSQEPNSTTAPAADTSSSQSNDQVPQAPSQSNQPSTQPSAQSQQPQQQQTPHEPVGTAAAESVQTTGVAASRPAGAAVAPAKQRRARSILIKVGAVLGVGAAVATTWALSQGSPSKPPGSH